MSGEGALVTFALALLVGVACQLVARHTRLPAILLLLAAGVVTGPEVLGIVDPRALGEGLFAIVEFGIAIILFEGGLSLPPSRLRRHEKPIRRLVTLGAALSVLGAAAAALVLLAWDWRRAVMFGSLVLVTGPTVVTPLLRTLRLHPRVKSVLEAEGVLIDPIGALVAALTLQVVLAPEAGTIAGAVAALALHFGFGVAAGALAGGLLGYLLARPALVPLNLQNIVTLAVLLPVFALCEREFAASGIVAVTVAGVVVGHLNEGEARELREFKDQMTVMLVGLLFVLLTADIELDDVRGLGLGGAAVVAALILLVRPLGAVIATVGSGLSWRERSFVALVAPRGIVAASIATLSADALGEAGLAGAHQLQGLVFLTIAATVLFASAVAAPVAVALGLRLPARDRVGILGADELSLALGDFLARGQRPVLFLEANPSRARHAEERGHKVVFGDALDERVLARAQFELVEVSIAITANEPFNRLFVQHAHEGFAVPRAVIALESPTSANRSGGIRKHGAQPMFDVPRDVERWKNRLRRGEVAQCLFVRAAPPAVSTEAPDQAEDDGDHYLPLAIKRGSEVFAYTADVTPKAGDLALVAVLRAELPGALAALGRAGWQFVEEGVPDSDGVRFASLDGAPSEGGEPVPTAT